MRFLITGGAGFIGSHLADALVACGDEVILLDDLSTGSRKNVEHLLASDAVELVAGSVLDADLVDDQVQRVDACFHLAAAVGVRLVVEQTLDSIRSNALGADTVISAAARHERRLLFASSSEVYGRGDGPLAEVAARGVSYRMHARRAYAASKLFGEALAESCARELGSQMVVARLFNAVGPRQTAAYGMVLPRFATQALSGADLTVYGDGQQTRCFVHVRDAISALIGLIGSDRAIGGIYNIGAPTPVRIIDLAEMVIRRTGSSSQVRFVPFDIAYEPGFEDLDHRIPDATAVRDAIGWEPTREIDHAVDDVIEYFSSPSAASDSSFAAARDAP